MHLLGFLYLSMVLNLKSYLKLAQKRYIYLFEFLMFIFINLPQVRQYA